MAAVSLLGSTFTTTAGAKSVTASPAVGDLILILVQVSNDSTHSTPTDNNSSGTYTPIGTQLSVNGRYGQLYIRNSLISSAVSTIFTLANPLSDIGGGLAVIKVTGMSLSGSAAVRQTKQNSQEGTGANIATGTWTSSKLTTNPIVGCVIKDTTSPVSPTTGYTELLDTYYLTPDVSIEVQKKDSGDTTNTMTWNSGLTTGYFYGAVGVELDAPSSATSTGNFFQLF